MRTPRLQNYCKRLHSIVHMELPQAASLVNGYFPNLWHRTPISCVSYTHFTELPLAAFPTVRPQKSSILHMPSPRQKNYCKLLCPIVPYRAPVSCISQQHMLQNSCKVHFLHSGYKNSESCVCLLPGWRTLVNCYIPHVWYRTPLSCFSQNSR